MLKRPAGVVAGVLLAFAPGCEAKPIAFANGTTVMAEYGAGTMEEVQAFHAPYYWLSLGGGWLRTDSDIDGGTRDIRYLRANYLVHRWNLDDAQANVFVWGGFGSATGKRFRGDVLDRNAGFQVDYETRRLYFALMSDLHESNRYSQRIDSLQLGFAPYAHDYRDLATWFVVQARDYSGGLHRGIEWTALVRLFKGGAWVEAGVTAEGKPQLMAMFNF
ncbi:MAG: hypothetical protein JSS42_12865 [Proteobacteria bacterium]|uniref:hypothetical protein n=1 Tax=Rudaea sp. TaxID=2136325 RepID=UPI003220979F|nr:hypothetical protein [Pseudomonadota bacterium]